MVMNTEYISKKEALSFIRQAYMAYLPQAHGPIMFIESGITNMKAANVRGVERAKWLRTKKHMWKKDANGEIDEFAWDNEFHNGPYCTHCFSTPCVHCKPDYEELETCHEHYMCNRCGRHSLYKDPFCTCGAVMEEENI